MRAATKQALIRSQEQPDERLALLPLVPLLPQWLVKRMVSLATACATSVVSSNFGVVDPADTGQTEQTPTTCDKGFQLGCD